jgi:hypothetical protein
MYQIIRYIFTLSNTHEYIKIKYLPTQHYHITNLTFDNLKMEIVENNFVHQFICFIHKYSALKTHLTYKYI